MAEALLSVVLGRLTSVVEHQIHDKLTLVVRVEKEIQSLIHTLRSIQNVVEDAERRQVKEKSVQGWLEKLKDMAYQMDDVVDEWSTALLRLQIEGAEDASMSKKKVCSCIPNPCFCLKQVAFRRDIALKIKSIKKRLDSVDREKHRFNFVPHRIEEPQRRMTTSAIDALEVYGRDMDERTILGHLLGENGEVRFGLYIISVIGMGGMGKTTLAQLVYNHPEVKAHFDERIWVCASDPFDPTRIFRDIVEVVQKQPCEVRSLEALQKKVEICVSGKKFLLVLDDVWTEDSPLWEQVKNTLTYGAIRSRILVTTRKESVAEMMRSVFKHPLGPLSPDQSKALFHQIAFSGEKGREEEELREIGEKLAHKCKGLPLAIKTLGNLMHSKNSKEDWEAILNHEVWQLNVFERDISPALLLSYYDLPPSIKRCFSFCAVFPKDTVIERDELIKLWMAHNFLRCDGSKEMEMVGRECFEYLVVRSFFHDFEKDGDGNIIRCKMHDIVHDFAQFLTKNECFTVENDKQMERSIENKRHATLIVREGAKEAISTSCMKNLHTLLVLYPGICGYVPLPFQHLTCLRALSLGKELTIPKEVRELIHLRYLDLSRCLMLRELPEAICNLYNLQTLNIRKCHLLELPRAIGKLINLRHIGNSGAWLKDLPKGIGRLTCLQTLDEFIVSRGDEKCKIGDLRNLNQLRGALQIRGLEKVVDASEAEKAELEKKIHLRHLSLSFDMKGMNCVAEALKPPSKLKSLCIYSYEDGELPSWMMRPSLTNLRKLVLWGFSQCSCLPPLGELPALENLQIQSMISLKYVGDEFLGSSSTIAFPKLKELQFLFMENWEMWEVKEEEGRSVMPSLCVLEMTECSKLKTIPDHVLQRTPLKRLGLTNCAVLKQRYGKDFFKVSHIPEFSASRLSQMSRKKHATI